MKRPQRYVVVLLSAGQIWNIVRKDFPTLKDARRYAKDMNTNIPPRSRKDGYAVAGLTVMEAPR